MFARSRYLFTYLNAFAGATKRNYKVAVVGAAGGIGQPLSLLLKMNEMVSQLSLYDIERNTPGVALDLSHINTPGRVTAHLGPKQISSALCCASIVVIPAGVPRKPGMKREDLFKVNASLIRDLSKAIAQYCPQAIVAIITNPVNSMVPLASEVLKKEGVYDPRRVLGVTTLDIVRACTFVGDINCVDPRYVSVPCLCGHSGTTIVPIFSQCNPPVSVCTTNDIKILTERVQNAGTQVVKAKAGCGSVTLSMAYAGARFVGSCLRGLDGESNVIECAYVPTGMYEPAYFANPILLGPCGIARNLGCGCLNFIESQLVYQAMPQILKDIDEGRNFAMQKESTDCKPQK